MVEVGWGFAPGTFGELVQGELDDTSFLVTLPIRLGTRARFVPGTGSEVQAYPPYRKKAQVAAEAACRALNRPGGMLSISSVIPIGKGLASSSADIVASMRAVAAAYKMRLPATQMGRIAASVEPSDGVMYDSMVIFNPRKGVLLERLGRTPSAILVGIVGPGRINTEIQHIKRQPYSHMHQERLRTALEFARDGVEQHRLELVGRAGKISAEIHAERHPDDGLLRELLGVSERESWGMVIGHTGTVRGFIFSPKDLRRGVVDEAEHYLRGLRQGMVFRFWTLNRVGVSQGTVTQSFPLPERAISRQDINFPGH